jgi:hypothetical protein
MIHNSDKIIARKRGYEFITETIDNFHNQFLNPAASHLQLNKRDEGILEQILNGKWPNHFLPMSNQHVRMKAWRVLTDNMMEYYELVSSHKKLSFFFLTCCWDDGLTSMVNPTVDLSRMKQKVRQALCEGYLNGLCALEFHPFRDKWPGENFRRVAGHIHGVVWTDDPLFNPRQYEQKMQKRFPNQLGADGFRLTSRQCPPSAIDRQISVIE